MLSAGLLEPLVGVKCTRTICHRLNAALAEALKECMKPAQDLTRENIRHRNSPNDSGNEARPIVGLRKRAGGESAGDAAEARSSVSSVSTYGHRRLPVCSTMLRGTERGNSAFAIKAACKCCRERGHTAHCSRAKRVGGLLCCCSVKTVIDSALDVYLVALFSEDFWGLALLGLLVVLLVVVGAAVVAPGATGKTPRRI